MVHARQVTAYLYDADDQVTLVTGDEAQYFMDGRDLEVFGNVKTTFPDGFQTESEYLRYLPGGPRIEMPEQYLVEGHGKEENGQEFFFRSMGMNFNMAKSEIILPAAVKFTLRGEVAASPSPKPDASSKPVVANAKREETVIDSDHCVIDRKKQIAHFTMYPTRKLSERFVHITQPSLFARGRRADVNYGSFDKILQYMIVYEDVYIREIVEGGSVRYGTGGRADFDAHRDVIVLKEFPQVYQDNDTVTGDIIIVHRDTDIVEVEHSNAYSSGETAQ
jgi:lipopolysaccharide export system protein LptA